MSVMNFENLSRITSHALRHEPWLYELELDEEGWVPIQSLVAALRVEQSSWSELVDADLERMIAQSEKKRHELRNGKIRAYYGHSVPQRFLRDRATPPVTLYHGTSPEAVENIKREGLQPMGRQFVHLSSDAETATKVGSRKDKSPVILQINAGAAHASGVAFYHGNEVIWLADAVPPSFID
jgi:putative RNA 2'-phosphotransferase